MKIEDLKSNEATLKEVICSNKDNTRIRIEKDNQPLPISEYKNYYDNKVIIEERKSDNESNILKYWKVVVQWL